jgi:perosamine synthetase
VKNLQGNLKLARFGGAPALDPETLTKHNPISEKSINNAVTVLKSGRLSEFVGEWCDEFFGGPWVQELEEKSARLFQSRFAVTVNSWTSGLVAAVGAIGIEPGDEIITTPYTMSATATSILHWNALPVFVDINPSTYNIDVTKIEASITERTKAILAVDIYGQPADMDEISAIAKKYGLRVITDSAQSPGAKYKGRSAGTLSDIGGYSFNFHKHIHSGEGGICFTDDPDLAMNLQLIRNHAEVVVASKGHSNYVNMLGHNFRMGELEASILVPQIAILEKIVQRRNELARLLSLNLSHNAGLELPIIAPDRTHAFYTYAMQIPRQDDSGVSRSEIASALRSEGVPISEGYQNIHLLPVYQKKIAYGTNGFPWKGGTNSREIDYSKGICPIAEEMHDSRVLALGLCTYDFTDTHIEQIGLAFEKVWNYYY